jgi:hypothetical protein
MAQRPASVIANELNEVERSLNRARDQRRRESRPQANGGFTQFVSSIAIAIYVLSRSAAAAALYLSRQRRHPVPLELDGDGAELDTLVERWHLQVDLEEITAVDFPETPFHQRVRAAADRFLAEKAVVHWIGDANAKGVAPSVADVADCFRRCLRQDGDEADLSTRGRSQRSWAARFRKRWSLRRRRLRAKEPLSEERKIAKVRAFAFALVRLMFVFVSSCVCVCDCLLKAPVCLFVGRHMDRGPFLWKASVKEEAAFNQRVMSKIVFFVEVKMVVL